MFPENLPPSFLKGSAAAQDYTPMDGIVADAFGAEDPLLVPELEEAAEGKPRKHKKVRILLDVRTELTDEELKVLYWSLIRCKCDLDDFHTIGGT